MIETVAATLATANDRDKGVNGLSAALKRRFNVVVLPLPDDTEQEIAIVAKRVGEMALSLDLPAPKNVTDEIRRVLAIGLRSDHRAGRRRPHSSADALAATSLAALSALIFTALTAQLPQAAVTGVKRLAALAGQASDCGDMLCALPELADVLRYGQALRGQMQAGDRALRLAAALAALYDADAEADKGRGRRGGLGRSRRTTRPRFVDIDWPRTIRANLNHVLPEHRTVVPERLIGFRRKQRRIVDLDDSVEVLVGVQFGGGTDINQAVADCEQRIEAHTKTHLILITDRYEGGNADGLVARIARLAGLGVNIIVLLALADSGHPGYYPDLAGRAVTSRPADGRIAPR